MTTFLDGPAKGVTLRLRRAPVYLRAVTSAGKWDALDQLDDRASEDETVFAYELVGEPTWYHIRAARGQSGCFRGGDYRLTQPQPDEAILRDTTQWQSWATSHMEPKGAVTHG